MTESASCKVVASCCHGYEHCFLNDKIFSNNDLLVKIHLLKMSETLEREDEMWTVLVRVTLFVNLTN